MTTTLPVIDLSPFAAGAGPSAAADEMARLLDEQCRHTGFLMVANHTVTDAAKQRMLAAMRAFFALPAEQKEAIAIGRSNCHRGYVGIGTETLDDANTMAGDLKETIDTGADHEPDHPEVLAGTPMFGPNQLPTDPEFRAAFDEYRAVAIETAERVMRAMAIALDLPTEHFLSLGEVLHQLRLVHYPRQSDLPPTEGQLGCGAHTDYGQLTVLADDGVGGLQVMRRSGEWIDVTIPADLLVVNLGDLMNIWTNGRWVSNPHRVVNPVDVDRYSMPLFVTPPYWTTIECLPSCLAEGDEPRFAPVQSGPYLLSRFDSTHSYLNPLLEEHNHGLITAYR